MAFGRREKKMQAAIEEPKPKKDKRRTAAETFLDEGSALNGDLRFSENVRLEGRVEGQICAGKTVIVGEHAEIDATVEAETLEVYGTIVGDIRVSRRTILHKTARVEGEIQTAGIVVEEGARFKGCIVIGPEEADLPRPNPMPDIPALDAVRTEPPKSREPAS